MDALEVERAVFAGYDWGGRAGCVAATLWPDRCAGLVSVNGSLVQDLTAAAHLQDRLSLLPPVTVPTVTLDGLADGNFPATVGTASAARFTRPRVHHRVPAAGHNLPQEPPEAFAEAVLQVLDLAEAR